MGHLPVIFLLVMTSLHVWGAAIDVDNSEGENEERDFNFGKSLVDNRLVQSANRDNAESFGAIPNELDLPELSPWQIENGRFEDRPSIFKNIITQRRQPYVPRYHLPVSRFHKRDFWIPPTRYKRVRVCPFLNRVGFPLGGCLYSYIKPTYKPPPPPPPPKPTTRPKPIPRPVIMWQPYQARWPEFYFLGGALGRR